MSRGEEGGDDDDVCSIEHVTGRAGREGGNAEKRGESEVGLAPFNGKEGRRRERVRIGMEMKFSRFRKRKRDTG